MSIDVSDEGQFGRVTSVSEDRRTVWILLSNGSAAYATGSGPFGFVRGQTVFVTQWNIVPAPEDAWPADASADVSPEQTWIGVVTHRDDETTVVDVRGVLQQVPTTDVDYGVGHTVQGSTLGISKVIARKSLRYVDRPDADDGDISQFRREPSDDVDFDHFGGLPEVVDRARELIELPLAHSEELKSIGARPVKGVLFTGLPGTGKTMLARIIANVAAATFYEISGPTVISKWVGESEQILRRIFADAAEKAPSIIFFDEIDSVAGRRTEEAHEASKRVVAQLLTLMDGSLADQRVTVIAATNRPQDIDVALRRPGRFDWEIEFPLPDGNDREAILRVSARDLTTDEPLPYAWLAANTEGWSAADLAAIWREAALLAVGDHARTTIMTEDVLGAHERVAAHRRRLDAEVIEVDDEPT